MLQNLTAAEFEKHLGASWTLSAEGVTATLILHAVQALRSPSPRPQPPFSLLLVADRAQPALVQGIYTLAHSEHESVDLFVVPIGPLGDGVGYEITFN